MTGKPREVADTEAGSSLRVLLSAFACDPVPGSEPYVGWSWTKLLKQKYDLTVLTRTYSARLIEEHAPDADVKLIHFDLPGCSGKDHYWRFIKPYYILWQFCALFFVAAKQPREKFRIVQQLTYNVIEMPGWLWAVPGTKFVWGPVGGGQVPPEELKQVYGAGWKKQKIRALSKRMTRFNPLVLLASKRSSHVFFANKETAALTSRFCKSHSTMLETAIDPPAIENPGADVEGDFLWLGNAMDRKALIVAIDAMGEIVRRDPGTTIRLDVAGDGVMLPGAKARAQELGLGDRVRFLGKVPFEQVMGLMERCRAFVFTSVQDTSGNVVLEAMSRGKPVITLDHQGAAEIVTPESGIMLPVADYDTVVSSYADAMIRLAGDADLARRLGEGAYREIMENHRWESRMRGYDREIRRIARESGLIAGSARELPC